MQAITLAVFLATVSCDPVLNDTNPDSSVPNDSIPSCSDSLAENPYIELEHSGYVESDKIFPNPERGFYAVVDYFSASRPPLGQKAIETQRFLNKTIFYIGFYLTDYIESDISEEYLNLIRGTMEALRTGGAKCVMRFAYSDSETQKPWDAKPEIVQRHIQSIKPILQEYSDVIMVLQAGFVGVWGEWYYTNNFKMNPATREQYALRKQVVDAMLEALPKDRSVGLRTPKFKMMMYADSYADSLTLETAHNKSDRARLSCFNDCFGASSNDMGTFEGEESRKYWKAESKYVFMGGETCAKSVYCTCDVSLKDMEDYHWTYLNKSYNRTVLDRWKNDGCMDEIERRLGYRLSLADVYHTPTAEISSGEDMRIVLKLANTGFSAPINPRAVELVFVDGNGNKTVYAQDDVDPRYWFAGEKHILDKTIILPENASGKCTLYLNLPDPKPTLHDNPFFSIRLANENVWEESTGYNKVLEFTL